MNSQLWKKINAKLENKNEGVNWQFSRYFFSLPGEGEQGCIEIVNSQNGMKTGEVMSLRYDVSGKVDVILEGKNAAMENQIWQKIPSNDGFFKLKNEKTQTFLTASAAATLITGLCFLKKICIRFS